MSCTCRLTPWRLFFRSLAQVHRLEVKSPPSALGLTTTTTRPTVKSRLLTASPRQGFHASARSNQQDEAVRVSHEESPDTSAQPVSTSSAEPRMMQQETQETTAMASQEASVKPPRASTSKADKPKFTKPKTPKPSRPKGKEKPSKEEEKEMWKSQKEALDEKFPEGWRPRKRLSPDALEGIRALNAQFPHVYTTEALAGKFEVSPEAIRRILKSKWRPSADEEEERQQRWFRRGMQVWEYKAALGVKPPKRWRREGIVRDPTYHEWSKRARERERRVEEDMVDEYRKKRGWESR